MMMKLKSIVFFIFLSAAAVGEDSRLDPFDLLQYRSAPGEIEKVTNAEEWQKRRAEILRGMEKVMGPYPKPKPPRTAPKFEVIETTKLAGYTRQLITYESNPGCETPAYLCLPDGAEKKKFPAVLCLHPTDNQVGHKVVVGLGGRAGRQYAAELAERGFVTISPSYPHLANYWPNLGKLGYVSGTMKAIWDNTRAIDLLESLDYVDLRKGVGAIGHSLGGHNAIYTAVFESRISVVVSSCGFDSYRDYYDGAERVWFFGKGWCQIRYMPRMSDYRGRLDEIPFDFPELLGAIAPRPIYINAPLHDSNFRWKSVDRCCDAARPVYQLLGMESGLIVDHPEVDHNFPAEQRVKAYQAMEKVLF